MSDARWHRISQLYHDAAGLHPSKRSAFLRDACAGDDALRAELDALLTDHAQTREMLEAGPSRMNLIGDRMKLIGQRIGSYQITSLLGVGGMGEVYRASDTKLGREVAIKVLPGAFAADADGLGRLVREARTLASLNHPHIGAIYGLEEASDVTALVLELVEGETLAERIERGPIPSHDVLPIARSIAEALEAAHEHGIVHRDLKPANIKITADGVVKVLDFGLAKAMLPETPNTAATQSGMIVGTASYMSPQQARGQRVDTRADVWAFGCVLYEMLTGRLAFPGASLSDTFAAILEHEPDWSALDAATPAPVLQLLRRCLQKDVKRRLQHIGDARIQIEDLQVPTVEAVSDHRGSSQKRPRVAALAWLFVVVGLASLMYWMTMNRAAVSRPAMQRLSIEIPSSVVMALGSTLSISPDGRQLVFSGVEGGTRRLYRRWFDQLTIEPLKDTEGGNDPFFSSDGRSIGFFGGGQLKTVAVAGGPARMLAATLGAPGGGSWGNDGKIVFQGRDLKLWQTDTEGSPAVPLTPSAPAGEVHSWPDVLPGGQEILFTILTSATNRNVGRIAVLSRQTGTYQTVIEPGYHARYSPTGHIVYVSGGDLMAVPFDRTRLEKTGAPVIVARGILTERFNRLTATFDVSEAGLLVYSPGHETDDRNLVWVDRSGGQQRVPAEPRGYVLPRLSPDGSRVALDVRDRETSIWLWDFARETLELLHTDRDRDDTYPVWTPSGERVAFASARPGHDNIYWARADGTGVTERIVESATPQVPFAFSPDGSSLIIREQNLPILPALSVLTLKDKKVRPLRLGPNVSTNGEISPNGSALAYQSNETGTAEIYVRPFPDVGSGRIKVSAGGGLHPLWSRTGDELFYLQRMARGRVRVMAAPVRWGARFETGAPQPLFEGHYYAGIGRGFDVSRDGQRFLMIDANPSVEAKAAPSAFVVVLNWASGLTNGR